MAGLVLPYPYLEDPVVADEVQRNFERLALDQGAPDPKHIIGATGEPAYQNLWAAYGAPFSPVCFYKDSAGIVHCEGLVASGTVGAVIFTFPTGYRPASDRIICSISNGAIADLRVASAGTLTLAAGSNVWLSLDNVAFRAG